MSGHQDAYIAEKMAEFDVGRAVRHHALVAEARLQSPGRRPFALLVRSAGRGMRRLGAAMELWASPAMRACETEGRRSEARNV